MRTIDNELLGFGNDCQYFIGTVVLAFATIFLRFCSANILRVAASKKDFAAVRFIEEGLVLRELTLFINPIVVNDDSLPINRH